MNQFRARSLTSLILSRGSFNELSNAALEDLVDAGAVVVVASGNDAADACTRSPGSAGTKSQ